MSAATTRTRVLVTVLTYPHPSAKYKELVCAAGVTAAGEWIRLYPVDYRYRPAGQRFHKYQWIELDVEPVGHDNDRRKESRRPHLETMVAGDRLDTKNGVEGAPPDHRCHAAPHRGAARADGVDPLSWTVSGLAISCRQAGNS